jgi:hypothetical protein
MSLRGPESRVPRESNLNTSNDAVPPHQVRGQHILREYVTALQLIGTK